MGRDANVFAGVEVLLPEGKNLMDVSEASHWPPFHTDILRFIGDFSKAIMKDVVARQYPEIISLAHWIRPKALLDLKQARESSKLNNTLELSRGIALHFAPGNVDTIFLYSALLSTLMGNQNIVRISQRDSPQITLLIKILNELFAKEENAEISKRLFVIRYAHDDATTAALSEICDLRVIWGGDNSVNEIRKIPLPPRSRDLTFPNRWSLAVIDSAYVIDSSEREIEKAATNFVNDSYWFGQMACSSPRLVLWRGTPEAKQKAAKLFWRSVRNQAEKFASDIAPVNFVNKLVAQDIAAIEGDINNVQSMPDNVTTVSQMTMLEVPKDDLCVGDGMFWEHPLTQLDELSELLDIRSQTIVSFGISSNDWHNFISKAGAKIDRIVPLGQALQFGVVWDGYNLLTEFSRQVAIEV